MFPTKMPYVLCQMGYTEAYEALPEPYKNDMCLTFDLDDRGRLTAKYDLEPESLWFWCPDCGEWVLSDHYMNKDDVEKLAQIITECLSREYNGNDPAMCAFCYARQMYNWSSVSGQWSANPIVHDHDCEGLLALKILGQDTSMIKSDQSPKK